MAFPHIFSSLSGSVPASYLDDNFNAAALASDLTALQTTVSTIQTGDWTAQKQVFFTGTAVATSGAATLNDYNPTGLSTSSELQLNATGAVTLTGMVPNGAGKVLLLQNTGTFGITLQSQAPGSAAANRFALGSPTVTIAPNAVAFLIYDSNASRWRATVFGRELLQANRTYFVATTGNDSNDGLTAGTPFLTIQAAINAAAKLDWNNFTVTVSVADGTYPGLIAAPPMVGAGFGGELLVTGNLVTPANVVLSNSVASSSTVQALPGSTALRIRGVKFNSSVSSVVYINAQYGAVVEFGNCEFAGTASYHVYASATGSLNAIGDYTISGGAIAHARAEIGSRVWITARTVTTAGTPAFSVAFVISTLVSSVILNNNVFTGTGATGPRYLVDTNSTIYTAGAGATYLPGNSAGSNPTGGQYT